MKIVSIAALFVLVIFLMSGCRKITGSGPVVTENRATAGFTKIGISIPGEVIYKQDNGFKLEIDAQQNILDVIETPVVNGELIIKIKNDIMVRTHDHIVVRVSSPTVTGLRVSGSGNLKTTGNLQTESLRMNISGSGNIMVPQLVTGNMEGVISGSGDMIVSSGTVNDEDLRISGSGSIDLANVAAKNAITSTSGSGTMKVNASETLKVSISGSGTVFYKGNPVITSNISGSGKIKPM